MEHGMHDKINSASSATMVDLSDWLKKESLVSILAQADKTKQDLLQVLAREWRSFLEALLADSTLEVHARIKLVPSDKKGVKVQVVSRKAKLTKPKRVKKGRAA